MFVVITVGCSLVIIARLVRKGFDMRCFGNRNDAVEKLRSAREDLEDYGRHQRERGGLDVDETPEYYRLNTRVSEARRNVSWWRR